MESILAEERKKSTYSSEHLGAFLYGKQFYDTMKLYLESGPILPYTPNLYNSSRLDIIVDSYRYLPPLYNYNQKQRDNTPGLHQDHINIYTLLANPHQIAGSAHFGMFVKYIELMGTEAHQKMYLDKAINCEITGCYAQT